MRRASTAASSLPALLLLLLGTGCGGDGEAGAGHDEAHDHGEATAVTVWSEKAEVFFEYPPLVVDRQSAPWGVHVTRLSDFSPVTEGSLTLAFRASDGTVYTTRADAPARPGIFAPAPTLPKAGRYELVIDIAGPQLTDRIRAGSVTVLAVGAEAQHAHGHAEGISFLKEEQWSIDFAVAPATIQSIIRSVEAVGKITPAADRRVEVAAPVSGLAVPSSNRGVPSEGEDVVAGQRLATLSPATGDDTYLRAAANVEQLEREVERLARLFEAEAIPEKRLLEARTELRVARTVLETLGGSKDGGSYSLRAPTSGVIHRRLFEPGEYVGLGETLFEIVSMNVVWLRVELPAQNTMLANAAAGATFTVEGSRRQFRPTSLVSTGSTIDPETRTLPVTFAVRNDDRSLRFGMFARVRLNVGSTVDGVAIPVDAIQNEDGVPVAWVQVGGETFQRRPLILGPTDGVTTIIEQGIEEGEYVVTRGAYQVYLASLNTEEIGGHGHPH